MGRGSHWENTTDHRGGSRIFLRRGAPLRNDFTEANTKKASSRGGGGGAQPLHPTTRSIPGLETKKSYLQPQQQERVSVFCAI